MPCSRVSSRMILSDLEWLSELFNDMKHCAASVRQLSFVVFYQPRLDQSVLLRLPPLPPLGHIWDMMLVWTGGRGILKKLSLCYSIVYYYNGAQRYEQFLQIDRLYRALILLGSSFCLRAPLCLRSSWCYDHSLKFHACCWGQDFSSDPFKLVEFVMLFDRLILELSLLWLNELLCASWS